MNEREVRKARPGRFEGGFYMDAFVAALDEDDVILVGDITAGGCVIRRIDGVTAVEVQAKAHETRERLTRAEWDYLLRHPFVYIVEDDAGFVRVSYFETVEDVERLWRDAERVAAARDEDFEAMPEEGVTLH